MRYSILIVFSPVLLFGCSSGDDGNTIIEGLTLPKSINIAAPIIDNATQGASAASTKFSAANLDDKYAGTDYANDTVEHHTISDGVFSLEVANSILCILDEMNVKENVNKGAYVVLISENICEDKSIDEENNTSSEGYIQVVVLSTRLNNQSPHIIKLWISESKFYPQYVSSTPGTLEPWGLYEFIVKESISEQNPQGIFDFNLEIVIDASFYGGSVGETMIQGKGNFSSFISGESKPKLIYVHKSGSLLDATINDMGFEISSLVELSDGSGQAGRAKSLIYFSDTSFNYESFIAADFNSSHLMTTESDNYAITQQCFSRSNYLSEVDGYNLYFETGTTFRSNPVTGGQRVELESYFLFRFEGQLGSAGPGYYWLPNYSRLPDQAVVTGYYNNESYTVHVSPGLLEQIDRTQTLTQYKTIYSTDTDLFTTEPLPELTLDCYSNCPIGGITQDFIDSASNISELYHVTREAAYPYTAVLDNYKIVLKDDSTEGATVDFSNLDISSLSDTITNILSGSLYPEGSSPGNSNGITYNWRSGPASFGGHLATFVDSKGLLVKFSPSLDFDYVHIAANDRYNTDPESNPNHNKPLNLYYYRTGSLSGLGYEISPGVYGSVSLADGTILDNSEGSFLVKATEIWHSLTEEAIGVCENLDLDANAVLNDTTFQLPSTDNMVGVSFTVSDMPYVGGEPIIID